MANKITEAQRTHPIIFWLIKHYCQGFHLAKDPERTKREIVCPSQPYIGDFKDTKYPTQESG